MKKQFIKKSIKTLIVDNKGNFRPYKNFLKKRDWEITITIDDCKYENIEKITISRIRKLFWVGITWSKKSIYYKIVIMN